MNSYTLRIKDLCDSLGSISVNVDDDEMVQICLSGVAPRFGAMRTSVLAKDKAPSFFNLQCMLLVEENHVGTRSNASEGHMLYTHSNGGRGRGQARGRFGQGQGGRGPTYDNNSQFRPQNGSQRGTSQEGGVSTPARVVKTQSNADIAENSATTKKSTERRCVNRFPQADNSRITRTIPTTKNITECMGTTLTTKIVAECTYATPTVGECS